MQGQIRAVQAHCGNAATAMTVTDNSADTGARAARRRTRHLIAIVLGATLLTACAATETRRSSGQVIDDSAITTKLKSKLLADPVTDGLDIEIETYQGRVQLNGLADSAAERERAAEIAREIAGVREVQNNLVVESGNRRVGQYIDDKVLVARVNAAFARDPALSALSVDVEANRGVVILGGFVGGESERRRAAHIAAQVAGVQSVRNDLQIR